MAGKKSAEKKEIAAGNRDEQEDPVPLTDEEFEKFRKKQKRESSIIRDIIEFILGFFQ